MTKYLYLIRHAKSSWSDPACSDFDRPLNKRGKHDAPMMGRRLAEAGVCPQLIVASPAKRARKTIQAISAEIGYGKKEIVYIDALYTFERNTLLQVLGTIDESIDSLGLVGHNYAITDCAQWLIGDEIENIPTCGVVAIALDGRKWAELGRGSGTLLFFDYPKLHEQRGSNE